MGTTAFEDVIASGDIAVDGDQSAAHDLLGLFDTLELGSTSSRPDSTAACAMPEKIYRRLMRVHLDSGKCQGHNRCYALALELFDVDDYGQAILLVEHEVPEHLQSQARLAASNCPEYAITITE